MEKHYYINRNIKILFAFFFSLCIILLARLIYLPFSKKFPTAPKLYNYGERDIIYDRNLKILAISYKTKSLYAVPEEIPENLRNPITQKLSELLNIPKDSLQDKFNKNKNFCWIKRKLSEQEAKVIKEYLEKEKTKGLYLVDEYFREYPKGNLASSVIGFVGVDNIGLAGIEYKYDDLLQVKISPSGKKIRNSIVLSIDADIQAIVEDILKEQVENTYADYGFVIVAHKSGEILALANYPAFDPNKYWETPPEQRKNYAVENIIEPGSVLKILPASIFLELYPNIQVSYYCNGYTNLYDHRIKCEIPHGTVNLPLILKYSCNIGMVNLVRNYIDGKVLYKYLKEVGFGEKVDIGLPGEARGILKDLKNWSALTKYSVSIGQEIGVTGLQLLQLGLIVANKGIKVKPKIIKQIINQDGRIYIPYENVELKRIFSSGAMEKLLVYLEGVLEKGGTAQNSSTDEYGVKSAGKTGTGQIASPQGGYEKNAYNAVFLGFVPSRDPQFVILVVISNPKTKRRYGGDVAAPVFKKIVKQLLLFAPSILLKK